MRLSNHVTPTGWPEPPSDLGTPPVVSGRLLSIQSHPEVSVGSSLNVGFRAHVCLPSAPQTALHVASLCGRFDEARFLLVAGATVDARDRAGCTPLHVACKRGDLRVASDLLSPVTQVRRSTDGGLQTASQFCLSEDGFRRSTGCSKRPKAPSYFCFFSARKRRHVSAVQTYSEYGIREPERVLM